MIDRDDVGMVERGDPLRLGAETLHVVRIARQHGWQHFDGDLALELHVEAAIDLGHATSAQ